MISDNDFKTKKEKEKEMLMDGLVFELPVLRARLGVSQAELADKIGVSRQTYNAIETHKKKMNWTVFMALISVFRGNPMTKQMIDEVSVFKEHLSEAIEL